MTLTQFLDYLRRSPATVELAESLAEALELRAAHRPAA